MSHSYSTRTFTVSKDKLPASFASEEALEGFEADGGGIAHARSDGLHHLWGDTRGGWAIYLMRDLLAPSPQPSALRFLTDSGHPYHFENEYGSTSLSVLEEAAVDSAAEELQKLLSSLAEDPIAVYDADEGGVFSGSDVEDALARTYVSRNPGYDPQVRGDEGEGADYLFTYLRSVLALPHAAQQEGLCVVHRLKI